MTWRRHRNIDAVTVVRLCIFRHSDEENNKENTPRAAAQSFPIEGQIERRGNRMYVGQGNLIRRSKTPTISTHLGEEYAHSGAP